MMILIALLFAQSSEARVNLLREETPVHARPEAPKPAEKPKNTNTFTKGEKQEPGNLPGFYAGPRSSVFSESPIILPQARSSRKMDGLNQADLLEATIHESLIAFGDSKAPVRAIVRRGPMKGLMLLGEATLEKNSKRILVNFTRARKPNEADTYGLQASTLDQDGVLGLVGKLESGEALYFGAEILAAGAAGYADSMVERKETATGYADAPTLANASRKAIAAALGRTADRFSDKLRAIPEYSVLKGPIDIKVIVTDEVTLK